MTAYVITGACNIDQLGTLSPSGSASARAGGDTVDTNGFNFTIDQDTRYGTTGGATLSLGSITINANKGGNCVIDGTAIRQIAYTGGSGNVPAYNTTITQSGQSGSGKLIRVQSAVNAAPTAVGAAMPASGIITVKQTTGTYASGALTGITATSSGADVVGFIELVGDESATINCNRLGTLQITGKWWEAGTTSGSSATTYQLPTNGSVQYYPAVYVDSDAVTVTGASYSGGNITYTCASHPFVVGDEATITGASPSGYNKTDTVITAVTATSFTLAGSDPGTWTSGGSAVVMEAYPCAGSLTAASSTATDAVRGKVHWSTTGGVLRFGSDGTNTVGYVPPSGRRIRIPNILTANCTTAARGTNALPNATPATRYDFTTTGGGVIDINKALLNWYPSVSQAYSVSMKFAGVATQLTLSEVAQPMTLTRVAVGQEAANTQTAFNLSLCYAGGTINGCDFTRAGLASGVYINTLTDVAGFTFNRCRSGSRLVKGNVGAGAWYPIRAVNCEWNDCTVVGAKTILNACSGLTFTNTVFADVVTGTTATTAAQNNSVFEFATAASSNVKIDGISFGGLTNVHPYIALVNLAVAGCSNVKLRNVGTYASPLSLGSANACGNVLTIVASGAAADIKCQRIYTANTRLNGFYYASASSPDNSSTRLTLENCFTDYADSADLNNVLNLTRKGIGGIPALTAATGIYGTHFFDCHTSTTAGRLAIIMNEATSLTSSYITLTGGAAFTATGGLYMPTIGMTATFELPYYCIGHTGFANSALVMAGGTATNYTYEYSIDKNDGNGYSTMTSSAYTATTLGTALNGLTGLSAVNGFKLKLKITTGTGNTTAITSVYLTTASTTTTQAYQYPLDTNTVTFTGLPTGCDTVVLTAGTTTVLEQKDALAASSYSYTYSGAQSVDVGFLKPGYVPYYIRNLALAANDSTIPVSLTADRNYA